ncbi:MAG TPA: arylamine N-acetyltransferase [Terriglobales bacterium]|nr:arylamine N-acetyltransferase [Terriglobales bacterium]
MDVLAYFDRIGHQAPSAPSLDSLRALHRAHMMAVPFENLDIALGRPIVCDEEAIIRKIVDRRRGGFCYELNGAFAALLRALGFKVTLLSARVPRDNDRDGPEFDHLALRVDLDEPWLADVGFGDSFLEPLRLQPGLEQPQSRRRFRIAEAHGFLRVEMAEGGGSWKRQYSFSLVPRQLGDFADMCHYHQVSPESPFTRNRLCSRATGEGRITLAGRRLIVTRQGKKEESLLATDNDWQAALEKHFQVVL